MDAASGLGLVGRRVVGAGTQRWRLGTGMGVCYLGVVDARRAIIGE